jgi:hypothetical protein
MLTTYERHFWALLNARPEMVTTQRSIKTFKIVPRSHGSKFEISYKLSVTVSKVMPMKEDPDQAVSLELNRQELITKFQVEDLVKSRQRVSDHGEVFTPGWMVEDMIDLVKSESERIDSRFLEPACGSGNFLKSILVRKLNTVQAKFGKSEFERKHQALFALMCIYGIELLADNLHECRSNLLKVFNEFLGLDESDTWSRAAQSVLVANILQGDALTLTRSDGKHIEFPEWGYLGTGKYQRRDFRFDSLTQRGGIEGTLFELLEEHDLFIPTKTYSPMNVEELAG